MAQGFCLTLTAGETEDEVENEIIDCENKVNSTCICKPGYEPCNGSPDSCCDINECKSSPCGSSTDCKNTPGSYNCTCLEGFQFKNGSQSDCEDIDECQKNASICGPNGSCINLQGKYMCTCKPGFGKSQKDINKICIDIDECKKENNCSSPATCKNTPGSYTCEERVTEDQECYSAVRSHDNCSEIQTLQCNFTTQLRNLCNSSMSAQSSKDVEKQLTAWLNLLDKLVGLIMEGNKTEKHRLATMLMEVAESWLRSRAQSKQLPKEPIRAKSSEGTELAMEFRTARSQSSAFLVQNQTQMDLNWQAAGDKGEAFSLINLLTYQGLEEVLAEAYVESEEWKQIGKASKWAYQPGKPTYQVLSKVTAAFVDRNHTVNLNIPVSLVFSIMEKKDKHDQKFLCAFWKPNDGSGNWSTEGCSLEEKNATHAHCQCNHLTSFAVLMAFYELNDWTLDVITKLGLVVSLVCLFLAILTFLFCRTIRGIRTTIHLNLCLALFAAHVIFLMGVERSENKTACAVVAGLLHYFFLSVFCWMLLEGVELYLMVVQVFKTHSLNHWHIFLVGYGLPAVVVCITAAVNKEGYGTESYCWLSFANGFLWSFLAPVCIIITFNAVVFVVTVWRLTEKFADINPDISKLKKQRVLTITAIAQLCILGLTWTCGLFQFSSQTIVISYIFTILNTLQGVFIFLLHCLLKKQVRDDYYHMFCHRRHRKGQSSDKYSEFTSSSASNTLRAHKSTQESGI
ncbi:adhesion G protein-coupled receptor E5 [Tiliqua scincoides]|uniref:adhesion G protein-coupled receptor E5 n=1 Tax=Tiliqua scincoides TaxID=71010 RepID=UPI0034629D66